MEIRYNKADYSPQQDTECDLTNIFKPYFTSKIVADNQNHSGASKLKGLHLEDQLDNYLDTLFEYSKKRGYEDSRESARVYEELHRKIQEHKN